MYVPPILLFPPLLIDAPGCESTLHAGCLKLMSGVPGRILPITNLARPSSRSKMKKSSRLHDYATLHGSQPLFSLTTSRAFWASCGKGQTGVWSRSMKCATMITRSSNVVVVMFAVSNSIVYTGGTRRPLFRMKSGLLASCRRCSLIRNLRRSPCGTSIKPKDSSRRRPKRILRTGHSGSE
jgi:hypothetical protein